MRKGFEIELYCGKPVPCGAGIRDRKRGREWRGGVVPDGNTTYAHNFFSLHLSKYSDPGVIERSGTCTCPDFIEPSTKNVCISPFNSSKWPPHQGYLAHRFLKRGPGYYPSWRPTSFGLWLARQVSVTQAVDSAYGDEPIEKSWRLNADLPMQVILKPKQEPGTYRAGLVLRTDSSRLDIGKAGAAVVWYDKRLDKWQEKRRYLAKN